ncbi:protease inhibitor I9 family protein [Streptomyces sp. NPDC101234]|uniref:protease inhibitor I9 family protein n=1 Tax=Streptomyces sp. NPDC101234 TaxID=3366138 RepID=UPI0037F4DD84
MTCRQLPCPLPGENRTLKDGAGFKASSTEGKGLVKEYGGTVKKTFGKVLNGYSAELSAGEAARLAADPAVATVPDGANRRRPLPSEAAPDCPANGLQGQRAGWSTSAIHVLRSARSGVKSSAGPFAPLRSSAADTPTGSSLGTILRSHQVTPRR